MFFGLFAISILASMFVIHFFLRAYWIGLVGLNSVFPDYDIDGGVYSKIYTEKILTILPKLEDSIKTVDELCSVIFSVAFTFLLIYSYLALFASAYLWIYNMLIAYIPQYILLIPVALFFLVLILQLIVGIISNLKVNHDNENLQTWNFKIVRFMSVMFYGPIYKYIMQVMMILGSNFKKKKYIVYLLLIFVLSGAVVAMVQMLNTNIPYLIDQKGYFDSTKVYSGYYKSENENNSFLLSPEIESDIIDVSVLKVFIPIFDNEKRMRTTVCAAFEEDKTNSKTIQRENRRKHNLDCYNAYNYVYLNGEEIKVDFIKYKHPKTDQFGILGYVELSKITKGKNTLEVKKDFGDDHTRAWTIPFYYIANND